MGRKRIFKEVSEKEFVQALKEHGEVTIKNISSVTWKQLYSTKINRKVEIPKQLLRATKIRHGVYDLTKL